MKLSCEIVQDLLPLYEDDMCSKASRDAIEEHLKECPDCRNQVQHIRNFSELEIPVHTSIENRAVVKSFRKIRRRWAVSLIAMLLVVPVLFLTINQVRGMGICYTNVDEILTARKFAQALEEQNYQKASEMMNYEDAYQQIQAVMEKDIEDFMPDFVSVTIGQDEWMAQESVYQQYLQYTQVDQQFWEAVIFEHTNFMIPIGIWNSIVSQNPDSFIEMDGDVFIAEETVDFGEPYVRMETKWGTYMVRQYNPVLDCTTAAEFCSISGLVPAELYQEALTELENSASENYLSTQEYYAEVADMTLNEYSEFMQERYTQRLVECTESGFEFQNAGYEKSAYDYEQGCWSITYGVEVTYQGASYPISILLNIVDGEIVDMKTSWSWEFAEGNVLDKALSMYYLQ